MSLAACLPNTFRSFLLACFRSTSLTPLGGGDTEEIIREQLSRNTLFFGEAGVAATRRSFVVVVGLGGVGSHAAHMLLRSGTPVAEV